jgi:hypothetical protein
MIPQTLFSCFGNVYKYKFLTNICTNITLKHHYAFINRGIVTIKVTIPSHKSTYHYGCIVSAILWGGRVHPWRRMHSDPRFKYPDARSGRSTATHLPYTLLYKYFKPILGQLSPPGKEVVFYRSNGSLGVPWRIPIHRIFNQSITYCSIRPGVTLRARVGTFIHKYLGPFWEWLYPPGKEMNFNRMNGSPGVPPGNLMDRVFNQRIVPFIHRLAGDATGKEAGWETNIGDTKHVNKHIN